MSEEYPDIKDIGSKLELQQHDKVHSENEVYEVTQDIFTGDVYLVKEGD